MKPSKLTILFAAALAALSACKSETAELNQMIDSSFERARGQYMILAKDALPVEGKLPRTYENGELKTAGYGSWICGFFPGTLWELSEYYPEDQEIRSYAEQFTERVAPAQWLTSTHDLGFMVFCSAGNAYRLTGDEKYKTMVVNAAHSLATRFNGKTGTIMSWNPRDNWKYPVIIDNMMNLEMLMWAGKETADSSLINIALSHAETTIRNHFRPDYSTYHVVSYNPETGEVEYRQTLQGYSDDSAWARGQAWGLYGYTMMYRMTGKEEFLEQAKHIAAFIANHPRLPEDGVPYWDFDDPDIPNVPRDASAAAIMASGFLELSTYDTGADAERWKALAIRQLRTLSGPEYMAEPGTNGGFLLKHSVGYLKNNSEVDVPLTYADYYFLEALKRLKEML